MYAIQYVQQKAKKRLKQNYVDIEWNYNEAVCGLKD